VDTGADWPISIISTQDVAGGARTWSTAGKLRATVVIKATFYLVKGAPMRLVQPAPILVADQHHEQSFERSMLAPADMAPYLPRAEVMFSGHAYAATPSPYLPVRLAVVGSRPLVDKSLHVFGERMWQSADQTTAPVPFTRIPIRYERSPRGYDENPVGMPQGVNLPVANIIDPQDANAAAGFGPIAPTWPSRLRLLRGLDPASLDVSSPVLPDAFAWSYFHAAPADQRCSFFEGNEWVVLEGLHPDYPRMESQLPSARAQARVYGMEATGYREIGLSADTLWIDGDHLLCCVVWRGNFEVDRDTPLTSLQVFAGLDMPGRSIPWPGAAAVRESRRSELPQSPTAQANEVSAQGVAAPPPSVETATATAARRESDSPATLAHQAPPVPPIPAAPGVPAAQPVEPAPTPMLRAGATLASPALQEAARRVVDNATRQQAVVIQEAPPVDAPAPGWARSPAPTQVPTRQYSVVEMPLPASSASLSTTMPQPGSQLEKLISVAAAPELGLGAEENAALAFDDSPTFAPDTGDIARIVAEAEAEAEAAAGPQSPQGQRPSPVALRPMKTTIRGLGTGTASDPPPTARVDADSARNLMQGEEKPTAQLPIPEMLLKLSESPASRATPPSGRAAVSSSGGVGGPPSAQGPITIHEPPVVDDEEETGRPTLTNMELPPVSVSSRPLVVHYGEMRIEVERRIREQEALTGLDLSDVDLTGFDLSGQKLAGSRLDRALLRGCRMRAIDLTGASLEGADLSGAELDDAMLERTNLVSAKLVGASLKGAFLTDANLTTSDARGMVMDQASGQRAMFCRAHLDGASANGVRFDGADFTEAQLDGARFVGALLPELRAYEVSAENADFSRSSLQNARFDGSVLQRSRFDGALAEDSMWDRAVLDEAVLDGAKLTGASFTKSSLRGASLVGADLSEARFNRAVLSGANVTGVDLGNVTLDGADLTGLVTGT